MGAQGACEERAAPAQLAPGVGASAGAAFADFDDGGFVGFFEAGGACAAGGGRGGVEDVFGEVEARAVEPVGEGREGGGGVDDLVGRVGLVGGEGKRGWGERYGGVAAFVDDGEGFPAVLPELGPVRYGVGVEVVVGLGGGFLLDGSVRDWRLKIGKGNGGYGFGGWYVKSARWRE